MRKKRRNLLVVGLVAVALVGGLGWMVFRNHEPQEPVYQGKRLSQWLALRKDGTRQPGSEQAVHQVGTNAIPTLLRLLRMHDSKLKLMLMGLEQKQHLISINLYPAAQRHWEAAMAFDILGADASNAVPALVQIYEEGNSVSSQFSTAYALGSIGPAAKPAVHVLLRTLADTNASAKVRGRVALVLDQLHAEPELVVPALTNCLRDSQTDVRRYAAHALGLLGKDGKAAVPALLEQFMDPGSPVRAEAYRALTAIDPEAAAKAGVK